jgi:uncharacterized membrane protein YeaQ/YmgE (transglycosylase-associated protein family)
VIVALIPALDTGGVLLEPGGVLAWIIVGLIAGWLAGKVVEGRGLGCLGDVAVGVAGAFIGGLLIRLLGFRGFFGFWGSIAVAFVGAVILLALLRALSGRRL